MASNQERADRAYAAMERYAELSGQVASGDLEHEPSVVLSDLLCDLMHYAEIHGLSYADEHQNAQEHFHFEMQEELYA